MESHNLDKLFKNRISQDKRKYQDEAAGSKDHIWQSLEVHRQRPRRDGWWKVAAVLLLLLLGAGGYFSYRIIQDQGQQIVDLKQTINKVQGDLSGSKAVITMQKKSLEGLNKQLVSMQIKLSDQASHSAKPAQKEVIYLHDTIVVERLIRSPDSIVAPVPMLTDHTESDMPSSKEDHIQFVLTDTADPSAQKDSSQPRLKLRIGGQSRVEETKKPFAYKIKF